MAAVGLTSKAKIGIAFLAFLAMEYVVNRITMGTILRVEKDSAGVWHNDLHFMFPGVWRGFILQLTIVGCIALALKTIFFVRSTIQLRKRNLVPERTMKICVGTWLVAAIGLIGSFHLLLPPGTISMLQLILVVTLILPANRILSEILFLDSSRHR